MNKELINALDLLEKEKDISKEVLFEAIENSLLTACKNHFGKTENMKVTVDRETGDYHVYVEKIVVDEVMDNVTEISKEDAKEVNAKAVLGDTVQIEISSKDFGRIATTSAKNVILQKIREEERKSLYQIFSEKEKDVVTGIVQRINGKNISIDLGKVDAVLTEKEQVPTETFKPTERIKLYIVKVEETSKGPSIKVSRTHKNLVKRLFENEVAEIQEGVVEIKAISREPGQRTKMAVHSNNPDVDPIGACVGVNGERVNAVVAELYGEKIDIIKWEDNDALFVENSLSPATVQYVEVDLDEKKALVVVPDDQLSLAIGREGQNAKLAAKLTNYKIDIKSESQAQEAGIEYRTEYEDDEYYDEEEYYEDEYEENSEEYGEYEDSEEAVEEDK